MKVKILTAVLYAATAILANTSFAQNTNEKTQRVSLTVKDSSMSKKDTTVGKPSITHHQLTVDGKSINYTASAGYMPMKDKDDKLIAKIFVTVQ